MKIHSNKNETLNILFEENFEIAESFFQMQNMKETEFNFTTFKCVMYDNGHLMTKLYIFIRIK